ncbi:hypothetical protein CAPTEDRAFT_185606 [Capitella teleta]|uniref:Selenoprotein O n=1 Tax=Capitella teleta TaxID=283909 RepID=R7VAB5_CAPTE|nr:hypothetical protein CAPTEDRAFT_185606 [Capitella teleta]|eukprot:ELU12650.1 hypothetical protein CAPTEDRAFT_185606 [Capitella teleta]
MMYQHRFEFSSDDIRCILYDCQRILTQICIPRDDDHEHYITSQRYDWVRYDSASIMCVRNGCSTRRRLSISIHEWKLSEHQLLLSTFPIEDKRHIVTQRDVPGVIFSQCNPTPFRSSVKLAAFQSNILEELLDMDPLRIPQSHDFISFVSGGFVLPNSTPLAHRYGGHQFGYWADQLGDGRAHLLGEYVNARGQRWELQLKGSGKTPYSRDGDGRAVLRSSIREYLCSEAMFHLVTIDLAIRDIFYNGNFIREKSAVILRLAESWFRIGSFEILAANGETENLKLLADFVIARYFPDVANESPDRYLEFYSQFVHQTAKLIAMWQSIGFVHGVMNSDNFSIVSLTIDYGPFRFMDGYDPGMVPNTSDDEGVYRYKNQPRMNMILSGYQEEYNRNHYVIFSQKLGLCQRDDDVVARFLEMLQDQSADFTMCFRQISEWSIEDMESRYIDDSSWALRSLAVHHDFDEWLSSYLESTLACWGSTEYRTKRMCEVNPRYVLRNWMAEQAIRAAERDDFAPLLRLQRVLQDPFAEQEIAEAAGFSAPPPPWSRDIRKYDIKRLVRCGFGGEWKDQLERACDK